MRHLSLSPSTSYSLFHAFSIFLRACLQKLPWQFTVTLHHFPFFSSHIFFIHLLTFPFSIKYTWAFAPPLLSFSLFFLFQTLSHVFLHYSHVILSWHFRTEALCLWEKMSQLYTTCWAYSSALVSVCVFFLPLLKNVCRPFILRSVLVPWGILLNHPTYIVYIQLSSFCCVTVFVSFSLCVLIRGHSISALSMFGQG